MKITVHLEPEPGECHSHLAERIVAAFAVAGFHIHIDSPQHEYDSWKTLIATQKQTLRFSTINYYELLHHAGFPVQANLENLKNVTCTSS